MNPIVVLLGAVVIGFVFGQLAPIIGHPAALTGTVIVTSVWGAYSLKSRMQK